MKKTILLCALLVGAIFTVKAQESHLGIKAGVNFSTLTGDGVEGLSNKTGYHFGVTTELGLSDNFSIQPEVLYSTQGAESEDVDFDINYVNIPVLAKLYVMRNFSLQGGPQFGYVVGDDTGFDLKEYDLSGAVGAELKIKSLFLQARYNFGLSDVSDSGTKNAVFQFSLGYNLL